MHACRRSQCHYHTPFVSAPWGNGAADDMAGFRRAADQMLPDTKGGKKASGLASTAVLLRCMQWCWM